MKQKTKGLNMAKEIMQLNQNVATSLNKTKVVTLGHISTVKYRK